MAFGQGKTKKTSINKKSKASIKSLIVSRSSISSEPPIAALIIDAGYG
jgi:hypothetical protein